MPVDDVAPLPCTTCLICVYKGAKCADVVARSPYANAAATLTVRAIIRSADSGLARTHAHTRGHMAKHRHRCVGVCTHGGGVTYSYTHHHHHRTQ